MTPEMAARILAFESTVLQYQGIRPNPERIHQAAQVLGRLGGLAGGAIGGSVRGGIKAEAARINGRKGGRPRRIRDEPLLDFRVDPESEVFFKLWSEK